MAGYGQGTPRGGHFSNQIVKKTDYLIPSPNIFFTGKSQILWTQFLNRYFGVIILLMQKMIKNNNLIIVAIP